MLEVVSEDIGREGGRFIDVDALRIGAQEAEKSCCGEKDIRFHDAKITIVSARHLEWRGFPAVIHRCFGNEWRTEQCVFAEGRRNGFLMAREGAYSNNSAIIC